MSVTVLCAISSASPPPKLLKPYAQENHAVQMVEVVSTYLKSQNVKIQLFSKITSTGQ
jgi:hypothetical protein